MSTSLPVPPCERAYPTGLREAELKSVHQRRQAAGVPSSAPVVGVALSGGGIRSATFCLGLFQALARQGLLRRIDYLSTVSGGGYFGSFLGAAYCRDGASVSAVEGELADNESWSVRWLRENGRFLSPNGAGDNWHTAAVGLRNWLALHTVMLTFTLLVLSAAALLRARLWTGQYTGEVWSRVEVFFWEHGVAGIWWSPWTVLPLIPVAFLMVPAATLYWATQLLSAMSACRQVGGWFSDRMLAMTDYEFAGRAQHALTRMFVLGLIPAVVLFAIAAVDSIGQTTYLHWAAHDFAFPALWAMLTGAGFGLFGFGAKLAVYAERLLGRRGFRIPFNVAALLAAMLWTLLIVLGLSVVASGFGWGWSVVWTGESFQPMHGGWTLTVVVAVCFVASWVFSRAFGFVNLSSMQQVYAARLARAYLGATNPERRASANHNMTELIAGDDLRISDYQPQVHGGPLHLINVTVNETISGRTQIERRDRKGLGMSVGPGGVSVGIESHALWGTEQTRRGTLSRLHALFEVGTRQIAPIPSASGGCFHALCASEQAHDETAPPHRVEALPLGRWTAISGAAFTTGTGASTALGLSLLLGLANIRLGYWWDSGISSARGGARNERPNVLELGSRLVNWLLPVQSCLLNECFARFHGPMRRHWYLSDGGHFENTGCYELIRRRVPFIICSDAGQDPEYEFADFANLVRKARIDFGAEIQVVRRRADLETDDPGVRFPMPKLEDLVHPNLLDVIGTPDDFPTRPNGDEDRPAPRRVKAHALLARIHYQDTDECCWLLLIKPGVMADESIDVLQYQRQNPLFPQEPTTDQYFDEAQWESYRKLGEHIGMELFTPPSPPRDPEQPTWSPSRMCGPEREGSGEEA